MDVQPEWTQPSRVRSPDRVDGNLPLPYKMDRRPKSLYRLPGPSGTFSATEPQWRRMNSCQAALERSPMKRRYLSMPRALAKAGSEAMA